MAKYRKKPIVIEAIRFTGKNSADIVRTKIKGIVCYLCEVERRKSNG